MEAYRSEQHVCACACAGVWMDGDGGCDAVGGWVELSKNRPGTAATRDAASGRAVSAGSTSSRQPVRRAQTDRQDEWSGGAKKGRSPKAGASAPFFALPAPTAAA